ncbi:MAG: COX15/CtaA family protein [Candidatus Acidoferrales bacterium]
MADLPGGQESVSARHNAGVHRFALLTAGATFLLLIAGALVTSNDAGLAVPDWPLSYGTWMPPMVGNIVYEHGHRMVATSVGLLTIALAVWLGLREPRRWVRRLGLLALGAIALQGILGGLTVLYLLPRPISIAHASLAQLFFCLTVSLAVFTGPGWIRQTPRVTEEGTPWLGRLCELTTAALFIQLVLGAAFRHQAIGVAPHLLGALAATVLIVWTARRARAPHLPGEMRRPALLLLLLLVAQLLLGTGAYLARLAAVDSSQPTPSFVFFTAAHLAVGALLLATSAVLTLRCHRRLLRAAQLPSVSSAIQRATP